MLAAYAVVSTLVMVVTYFVMYYKKVGAIGEPDIADMAMYSYVAFTVGILWPFTILPGLLIGSTLLYEDMKEEEEE